VENLGTTYVSETWGYDMKDRAHEECLEAYRKNKKKHQGEESQGAFERNSKLMLKPIQPIGLSIRLGE
jgi:hypothetical protein